MVKWLTAAIFSAFLWFAIFATLRVLGIRFFSIIGLAIAVLVPVTVGLLIGCVDRFAPVRKPWCILDLRSSPWRQDAADIDRLQRRRASMRFSAWKPGAKVTIH
jgi:hypothetical protein